MGVRARRTVGHFVALRIFFGGGEVEVQGENKSRVGAIPKPRKDGQCVSVPFLDLED